MIINVQKFKKKYFINSQNIKNTLKNNGKQHEKYTDSNTFINKIHPGFLRNATETGENYLTWMN